MSKAKRTGWNKGTDKPVHSKPDFEVYERCYASGLINCPSSIGYSVFRDGLWYFRGETIQGAVNNADRRELSDHQTRCPWRGLSSPPKGF